MRLHRCLEHIKTKRSVAVGLHFFAGGIDRCRHILDKRHHVSKEFHHAPHTHVFHGAHAENRIDRPIHQSLTDTFAHFILGKMALIKELLHQGLIVLGRSLNQLLVQLTRMLHLILRNIRNNRYTTVGSPFIFLHQQHINHRVKAGTTCQRILNGDNLFAKHFTHLLKHIFIIGLLPVKLIHRKDNRLAQRSRGAEYILRAHFHAILCINHNHTGVRDIQRSYSSAHKVIRPGTVDKIQLAAKKLRIKYSGKHRVSIFFFHRKIITYRILCADSATTFYHPTLEEHSFRECGFAGTLAAEQGYVFDFLCFVNFHNFIMD